MEHGSKKWAQRWVNLLSETVVVRSVLYDNDETISASTHMLCSDGDSYVSFEMSHLIKNSGGCVIAPNMKCSEHSGPLREFLQTVYTKSAQKNPGHTFLPIQCWLYPEPFMVASLARKDPAHVLVLPQTDTVLLTVSASILARLRADEQYIAETYYKSYQKCLVGLADLYTDVATYALRCAEGVRYPY